MSQLIRWSPVPWLPDDIDKLMEDFGKFDFAGFTPAIDIYQTNDEVVVDTPLPGINPEDIEITVEQDVLTIRGKREQKSEVDEKNYFRREVRHGSFYRAAALPAAVDGDRAEAIYDMGVLRIKIPKAVSARPKTIKIKTSVKS